MRSFFLSRAAYQKLLSQGWTDAIRTLHPDEAIYTFWDYFRNAYARNAGIRIDHFLLNAPAAKMLVAAGVERDVRGWEKNERSRPAWIELAAKPKHHRAQASRQGRNDDLRIRCSCQLCASVGRLELPELLSFGHRHSIRHRAREPAVKRASPIVV